MTSTRRAVPGLSPAASRAIRGSAIASAVVIAICATALSYSGLHELALASGVDPRLAFVWPVIVDGLQLVGSLGVMYSTLSRISTVFPWFLMLLGTAISVVGNWIAAPDHQVTAQVLHAASPVILALVLEELMRVARHKVSAALAAADQARPEHVRCDQCGSLPGQCVNQDTGQWWGSCYAPGGTGADTPAAMVQDAPAPAVSPEPAPQSPPPAADSTGHWPTLAAADPDTPTPTTPQGDAPTPAAPAANPAGDQAPPVAAPAVSAPSPSAAAGASADGDGEPWATGTIRERTAAYLAAHPGATAPQVYKALGTDPSTTRRIYKEILEATSADQDTNAPAA